VKFPLLFLLKRRQGYMKESIKVLNNNRYNVGLMCQEWSKSRIVKPNSFIYLNEKEIRQLDSDHEFFRSGELVIDDSELNVDLGYAESNPNIMTDKEVEDIFKLSASQIKEKLSGVTELFAINRIYEVAKRSDLTVARIKAVEEIVGKKIELEDIKPTEEVEVKKAAKAK
jgi:hypothetical protein